MSLKNWLTKWIDRLNRSETTVQTRSRGPNRPQRTRLICEMLESRLAPAAIGPEQMLQAVSTPVTVNVIQAIPGNPFVREVYGALQSTDITTGPDGNLWSTGFDNSIDKLNPATGGWFSESAAGGIGEVVLNPSVNSPITPNGNVNPVSITYGTALANSQLSGTATATLNGQSVPVAGTFSLTSPANFVLTNTPAKKPWTNVVGPQLTKLYRESLPYYAARQVASFVPSNDLESLDVANGEVAVDVRAFVNTSAQVTRLGGQVTAVLYLPVAVGMPGVEVQAMLPIIQLPAVGKLKDVVFVTGEARIATGDDTPPNITADPSDQTVAPGGQATFTAAATGVPTPTVQWQVSCDGGKILVNIPGATSTTFTLTVDAGQNGDEFRAVFSNELGEVSTTAATLAVHSIARVATFAGNTQRTVVGTTAFDTPLEAQVTDRSGHPLAAYPITFSINSGSSGASATFAGSISVTVTTNDQGLAVAPELTANAAAGSFTVTAKSRKESATFRLNNVSSTPASIVVAAGNGQHAYVGSAFATLLQALVTDSYGNPVAGVSVTFGTPVSGPSGSFSASATVQTNAQGIATAPGFTANRAEGTFTVAATVAGPATAADFTLNNTTFLVNKFPISTPGQPFNITLGSDGNLWFTSFTDNIGQIGRITPEGTVTLFTLPSGADPFGVAAGADGNIWFTDFSGNNIGRITPSGTITDFAIPTADSGPLGITAGPDGNLWFTEVKGNAIGRITPAGTITEFPWAGGYPGDITGGPDGNLWYTEAQEAQIGRITPSGAITQFPLPRGSIPGGITTGPDGNLWFTDAGAIGRMTPSGSLTEFALAATSSPGEITIGPDGNLWFTEANGGQIGEITPLGIVSQFSLPGGSFPEGITAGPNGSVWFAEDYADAIGEFILNQGQPALTLSQYGTGNSQTTAVSTAFLTRLEAQVTDASGSPVPGCPVAFTVDYGPGGAGAHFANATTVTVTTNDQGIAIAPVLTANKVPGSFSVTSAAGGVSTTFVLTNSSLRTVSLPVTWWANVIGTQLAELYQEFLPYEVAGQVASFVASNDLESLDVANGEVAIDVTGFTDTEVQLAGLGAQVTSVQFLPGAVGVPDVDVQAILPILKLPAVGALILPGASIGPEPRIPFVVIGTSPSPSITTDPSDQIVAAGGQATFAAAATGIPTPTVQWQVSGDGGKIFVNIPGATSTTFTFTSDAGENGDAFRAVFSNEAGEVSTTAATLTVIR